MNPFTSPQAKSTPDPSAMPATMTVRRGFVITILSALGFAIAGGLIGLLLGTVTPSYYRAVFDIPPDSSIIPVHVGLGLGFTQGLILGIFVGLTIVLIVAWHESRVSRFR